MGDMVVPGERTSKSMGSTAGGGGGGGVGVGMDAGGVRLEGARDLPDKKKLQRKSVSFTGEEGYQLLGSEQSVTSLPKGAVSAGGTGKMTSPVTVAPASTFFLRANRATSPMVTPHGAYATFAKNIPPHASSATATGAAVETAVSHPEPRAVAPRPAGVGGGGAGYDYASSSLGMFVPSVAESPTTASVTPPQQRTGPPPPPPTVAAATTPATVETVASRQPQWSVSGGGVARETPPSPTLQQATTDASAQESGGDGAAAAAAAIMAGTGGADSREGSQAAREQRAGEAIQRRLSGEDESARRRRPQEVGDTARVVGGGERDRFYSGQHDVRRALPNGGDRRGEGGGGGEGGVAGLGDLEQTPPALYEDVIDTEVGDEGDGDDDDDDDDDAYELADDVGEGSPYRDNSNDGGHESEGREAGYSPGGTPDRSSGETPGQQQQERPQRQEPSPWSAVPESGGSGPWPRSRGKRSKWDIGNRYRFIRTLGRGSYGEVAQCEDLKAGGLVAIKRVLNVFNSEADAKRIYREMYILRHIRHNEIIHLKDVLMPAAYENFRDLYLVFEFVDTDLYKLIGSPQFLTDEHVKIFLYQMLIGLKYVHSAHVIHRDIKPANVLLNEDCTLKVCDFGLSRVVTQEPSTDPDPPAASVVMSAKSGKLACSPMKPSAAIAAATSHAAAGGGEGGGAGSEEDPPPEPRKILKRQLTKHVVTRWYRAPELILLQDYNNAVDVWSLGCILAELLSMQKESYPTSQERNALFPGKSCFPLSAEKPSSYSDALDQLNVIFDVIGTPSREDIQDLGEVQQYLARLAYKPPLDLRHKYAGASRLALDLLSRMLRFDPSRRITIDEALEHPYLASCRKPEKEVTARVPITMEFEHNTTDKATLKRLIYEEVLHYHPEEAARLRFASAATHVASATAAAPVKGTAAAAAAPAVAPPATMPLSSSSKRSRDDVAEGGSAAFHGSATVKKHPGGAMIDHQERWQKRQRLAGTEARPPELGAAGAAAATDFSSLDHRHVHAAAAAAVVAAAAATGPELAPGAGESDGDDDYEDDGLAGGGGGTKRSRQVRDAGDESPPVPAGGGAFPASHPSAVGASGSPGGGEDGYNLPSERPRGVQGDMPPVETLPCLGSE